eukprot:gene11383-15260_t
MKSIILLLLFQTIFLFVDSSTVSIAWNLSASTVEKKGKDEKQVIKNIIGTAYVGKIHAIMGPSGSGKSTLLNSLAGVVPKGSMNIRGSIICPQQSLKNGIESVYIQQEDILFAQLTAAETLDTSCRLRAKSQDDVTIDDCDSITSKLMNDLGLAKSKSTKVGDAKTRGLSGGEKKRLSIGNELILENASENAIIFADEPTSGLDCFQAQNVMNLLQSLALKGSTIVLSIHQPRSSIYTLFDDITILSEGEVIFSGPRDDLEPYFQTIGYPCPKNINPAEYYIDLVSIDYTSPENEQLTKNRIKLLSEKFKQSTVIQTHLKNLSNHDKNLPIKINNNKSNNKIKNIIQSFGWKLSQTFKKLRILHLRAWRQVTRDKALNFARFASSLFSALLFGAIYFRMGKGVATIPDRLGLLQVAAVNTAMLALIKATTSFVSEKLIIQKERKRKAYSVFPYFISKLIAEIPLSSFFPCMSGVIMYKLCGLNDAPGRLLKFVSILVIESIASTALGMSIGSFVPSAEAGVAVAPAVMVIFIVFGGLYVVNTPAYLSWVPQVSLIRWAYEALCVNEFTGLELISDKPKLLSISNGQKGPPAFVKKALEKNSKESLIYPGERVLDTMGFGKSTIGNAIKAQFGIILFNYAFTIFSLIKQNPKYESVQPIIDENDNNNNDIKITFQDQK